MTIADIHARIDAVVPGMLGWCTPEKAKYLAGLIDTHKPELVVEIGVFGGRSLLPMAMALEAVGGVAFGIDPWSVAAALEGEESEANRDWWSKNVDLENVFTNFVQQVLAQRLTRTCRWIRAESEAVAPMFEDASIGLLHLDSNHSELVSCRDVATWRAKVAPAGIWVLDDSNWASQAKAIEMIKASGFRVIRDAQTYLVFQRE